MITDIFTFIVFCFIFNPFVDGTEDTYYIENIGDGKQYIGGDQIAKERFTFVIYIPEIVFQLLNVF